MKNKFMSMFSKKKESKPPTPQASEKADKLPTQIEENDDAQMEGGASETDTFSSKSKAISSSDKSGKSSNKLTKAERDAVRARREQEKKERAERKAARDAKRQQN